MMRSEDKEDNAKDLTSLAGVLPNVPYGAVPAGASPFGLPSNVNPFFIPFDPDAPALSRHEGHEQLLFPEAHKKHRSWGEKICYGTGISYVVGLGIGGAWGLAEGLRHKEATSYRLQLTTVLNAVTKRGPSLGNRIGVLALGYNGVNGALLHVRDDDDALSGVVAGAVTGAAYQITSGPRGIIAGVLAGAILGSVIGGYQNIVSFVQGKRD